MKFLVVLSLIFFFALGSSAQDGPGVSVESWYMSFSLGTGSLSMGGDYEGMTDGYDADYPPLYFDFTGYYTVTPQLLLGAGGSFYVANYTRANDAAQGQQLYSIMLHADVKYFMDQITRGFFAEAAFIYGNLGEINVIDEGSGNTGTVIGKSGPGIRLGVGWAIENNPGESAFLLGLNWTYLATDDEAEIPVGMSTTTLEVSGSASMINFYIGILW